MQNLRVWPKGGWGSGGQREGQGVPIISSLIEYFTTCLTPNFCIDRIAYYCSTGGLVFWWKAIVFCHLCKFKAYSTVKVWLSPIKNSWIPLACVKRKVRKVMTPSAKNYLTFLGCPGSGKPLSAVGSAKGFKGLFDCMSAIIVELLSKLETQVNKVTPPYVFSCVFLISPLIPFYSQVLF